MFRSNTLRLTSFIFSYLTSIFSHIRYLYLFILFSILLFFFVFVFVFLFSFSLSTPLFRFKSGNTLRTSLYGSLKKNVINRFSLYIENRDLFTTAKIKMSKKKRLKKKQKWKRRRIRGYEIAHKRRSDVYTMVG